MTAARDNLSELRDAIDSDRPRLVEALGIRRHGTRYFCPKCQNDGRPHKTGDFSIEAGFRCHKCGLTGDGFSIVRLVNGCDFPDAVAFVRDLYGTPDARPAAPAPAKKSRKIYATLEKAAAIAKWSAEEELEGPTVETRRDMYQDTAGRPFACVLRFDRTEGEGKTYRPVHPNGKGWALGDPPGLWPLFRLPEIMASDATLVFTEGEKAASAGAALGLLTTATVHGAKAPEKTDYKPVAGRHCVILPDNDEAGRTYAATVAGLCHAAGALSVRIVELPGLDEKGDLADLPATPETAELVKRLAREAKPWQPPALEESAAPSVSVETTGKPAVLLPAGAQSISDTGRALGELLAKTDRFFVRGGAVVKLGHDPDGLPHLEDVKPAALASDFESVASLRKATETAETPTTCPEQTAKLISASGAFREAMRPIRVLTRCPVLIERGRELIQISGYDRQSGILAGGDPAAPMDVSEARRRLAEILDGFRFATPADRARALAALVTPALIFGGLLRGRAPVDLGEADASQTGKGFRNKLTAAVYGQSVKTVTQQRAGVGSMEESFNMALIRGANFIALDNVRGRIDSPSFESFLTEDTYHARAPYREPVEIDPRRVCIMLTSNRADVTTDLANRCACVRILKQPDGHAFTAYAEGDILEHLRANQARYLGAVFAIVRAWFDSGKPRTAETRHDFRPWAQTLDWITRHLLDAGPLLDGHRETQARMTNPVLNWLRDVALEVLRARQAGAWLRAGDIVDLLAETATETPGLPENGDLTDPATRENVQRATGRKLGLCFRAGDVLALDGMTVERREGYESASRYTVREYRFQPAAIDGAPMPAPTAPEPKPQRELDLCGHGSGFCGHGAAIDAAIKPQCAAIAANAHLIGQLFSENTNTEAYIVSMGTHGRMAATAAPFNPEEVNAALALAAAEDAAEVEEGDL